VKINRLYHRLIEAQRFIAAGATLVLLVPIAIHAQGPFQEITVVLADYGFSPATIAIEAGTPVRLTLTNKDSLTPHNFSLEDPSGGLDININVGAGASLLVEFAPHISGS
jgi:plastocyanin